MKRYSGFSLIEIMVVITIIGILAAIAIPQYTEYVRRSALTEASSTLADLRVRMEQSFQDNRTYIGATFGTCNGQPPAANSTRFFTYTCATTVTAGVESYVLTATGIAGTKAVNFIYTLDNLNVRRTTSVPTGFSSMTISSASPALCFIVNKGASSC